MFNDHLHIVINKHCYPISNFNFIRISAYYRFYEGLFSLIFRFLWICNRLACICFTTIHLSTCNWKEEWRRVQKITCNTILKTNQPRAGLKYTKFEPCWYYRWRIITLVQFSLKFSHHCRKWSQLLFQGALPQWGQTTKKKEKSNCTGVEAPWQL